MEKIIWNDGLLTDHTRSVTRYLNGCECEWFVTNITALTLGQWGMEVGRCIICELPRHDNNVVNQFVLTRLLVCDELIQNLHDQE